MAPLADRLEVLELVGPAVRLADDVIDLARGAAPADLAEVEIALEDELAQALPRSPVAAFLPRAPSLVLGAVLLALVVSAAAAGHQRRTAWLGTRALDCLSHGSPMVGENQGVGW
jgi:hypothetical protein